MSEPTREHIEGLLRQALDICGKSAPIVHHTIECGTTGKEHPLLAAAGVEVYHSPKLPDKGNDVDMWVICRREDDQWHNLEANVTSDEDLVGVLVSLLGGPARTIWQHLMAD